MTQKTPIAPSRVGKVNIAFWTTPERRQTLKIVAARLQMSMQDIQEQAIDEWLKRHSPKGAK